MGIMTLLVESGADVNDIGGRIIGKMTALHAFCHNAESVRYLADKVADVNSIDEFGDTPLHKMVEGSVWKKKESVEILIAAGADVNATNFDGLTPLDSLLCKSHFTKSDKVKRELEKLLRKNGARTSEELNPLDKKKAEDDNKGLDILINE